MINFLNKIPFRILIIVIIIFTVPAKVAIFPLPKIGLKGLSRQYHTFRKQVYPYPNQGSLFVGMISIPQSDERKYITYCSWIKKMLKYSRHSAIFISEDDPNSTFANMTIPPLNLSFPEKAPNIQPDINRAVKRITGMKYFLEQTNHEWYLSATDDVYIDFDGIDLMLEELEKEYNPLTDYVIKGHCFWNKYAYLQGGTGYLFSRAAAKQFYENGAIDWIKSIEEPDDMATRLMFKYLSLSISSSACPYMFGIGFTSDQHVESPHFYRYIHKKCPKNNTGDGECRGGIFPLSKLYILHVAPYSDKVNIMNNFIKARNKYNDIYFYHSREESKWIHFCKGDPYINDDYELVYFPSITCDV